MKIAAFQGEGVSGDIAKALDVLRAQAAEAARAGAGLAIFPEMFLTGYNIGEAVFKLAEPVDGPSAGKAADIARTAGVALLYGYPERDGDTVYNSALLVGRDGAPLANYRKTHLYGSEEKRLFAPGDSLMLAELDGLKIGLLICYDVEFPEAVRALALAGAELIAVPTALIRPFDIVARTLVPARAFENQVYVAAANHVGNNSSVTFCGSSRIVDPFGVTIASASEEREALILGDIEKSEVVRVRKTMPVFEQRREDLYYQAMFHKHCE